MWVRSAAIRPVPSYAQLSEAALGRVEDHLSGDEEATERRLNEMFEAFEQEQPELSEHVGAVLSRSYDELAVALGYFLCLAVWQGFRAEFGSKLRPIDALAIRSVEEALALDEQLRGEDPLEALDSDDVIAMEQPHVLNFVHEHIDAALEVHATSVDVDDVHAIYKLLLVEVLALSYAVAPPLNDVAILSEMHA
jgi:hypothetical protein